MKSKYFYPIFKLKVKSWIRYWLLKKTEFKGKLSEILTGFSFNLQNTLRQKFVKFEIEGNSVQNGEPSPENEVPIKSAGDNVNELQNTATSTTINNVNFTVNDDGTVKVNGTASETTFFTINNSNMPVGGKTLNGCPSGGSTSTYELRGTDTANHYISDIGNGATFGENLTLKNVMIRIQGGYTANNLIFKPKIVKGSTATPWSPYEMGSITEKIVNENLWTSEWEQGYIDANGGLINSNALIRTKDYIYFEPGQHYAIKRSIYTAYMNVRGYDKNKKFVGTGDACINLIQGSSTTTPMNTANTCVISTKPGIYYLKFNDASNDLTTQYMMVKGDTPEDYIESEEQTYSIYTQQPFRSIGDVRDVFFKNTQDSPYYDNTLTENGWYERHIIQRKIFDGTEEWITNTTNTSGYYRFVYRALQSLIQKPLTNANIGNILSNFYIPVTAGDTYRCTDGIDIDTSGFVQMYYDDFKEYSVNEFKQMLEAKYTNGNPVYIDYALITPTYLPCTAEQIDILENIPETFKGQTNVYSTDEVESYLKIQYWESE